MSVHRIFSYDVQTTLLLMADHSFLSELVEERVGWGRIGSAPQDLIIRGRPERRQPSVWRGRKISGLPADTGR
jgi:hypothetical protein